MKLAHTQVLLVEDDASLAEAIVDTLLLAGAHVVHKDCAESAVSALQQAMPDIVVSDINMSGMDGLQLLAYIKKHYPSLPVLLMTAYGTVGDAVQAMQAGAVDYLLKPFSTQALLEKVEMYRRTRINDTDLIAVDTKTQTVLGMAKQVAATDATVLISGESGTGKEVLARYIHRHSARKHQPFCAINCAAIPESMLEATLFGYEKGAFTGAHKSHAGKFEQAQQGTLLLDEISEMAIGLQSKLLRVLQERELERIGGQKTIKLDVRVIATTNCDMPHEIAEGRFREDLFYRLNVFPLQWQPLRDRPKDLLPLVTHLLQKHASRVGRTPPSLTEAAKDRILRYSWPGNIREMDNVVQRALILQPGAQLQAEDLQITVSHSDGQRFAIDDDSPHHQILKALKATGGSRTQVAKQLGITTRALRYRLAKLRDQGIEVPEAN